MSKDPKPGQRHIGIQLGMTGYAVILFCWVVEPVTFTLPTGTVTSTGHWAIVTEHDERFEFKNDAIEFGKDWAAIERIEFREEEKI